MQNNSIACLDKSKCYSCHSCVLSCPKNAIRMQETSEGFLYPDVNAECVHCGICIHACPALTPPAIDVFEKECYCAYLLDSEKRMQSTSGGVFSGLAEKIILDGGIVFGAAYDTDLNVSQIAVDNLNDLQKLKGSKYVESYTGDSFKQVKLFLDKGRTVLYSGTPCMIAGLKTFLGKTYENLITVDIICHGVPSRKLFRKYLEWLGKKYRGKIIYYGFRDKDVGGWSCGGKAKTKTKTKTKTIAGSCDPYYASFLRGETYRESCYTCPFANTQRIGDITLGDFWGVERFYPEIDRTKGVSCVIVNSCKGQAFFDSVKEKLNTRRTNIESILFQNDNLKFPTQRSSMRNFLYDDIDASQIKSVFSKFKYNKSLMFRIRVSISNYLPSNVKQMLRVFLRRS